MTSDWQWQYRSKKLACFCVLLIAYCLSISNAYSDQSDKAFALYDKGRYKAAGKIWRKLGQSRSNDGSAYYRLAELYKDGLGYEKHHGQAASWYRLSAEKGYLPAMHDLGVLHHRDGDETVRSTRAAELWWGKAADRGYVPSQLELAQLYISGEEKNLPLALKYSRAAALKGDSAGFLLLKDIDRQIESLQISGVYKLFSIPPDHYTLSLASFVDFDSAWAFLIEKGIQNARIHRSVYSEFDVTIGDYASIPDAYAGILTLDQELRALRPKPRRLEVIHHELVEPVENLGGDWVKQRNPSNYTVELYRANADINIYDLVAEAGLSNSVIYRSVFADSVLIAGIFTSLEEANQVISNLPESLSRLRPRARQFARVQAEVLDKPAKKRPVFVRASIDEVQASVASDEVPATLPAEAGYEDEPVDNPPIAAEPSVGANAVAPSDEQVDPITALFSAANQWLFDPSNENSYSLQVATVSQEQRLLAVMEDYKRQFSNQVVHLFDQSDPEFYYFYVGKFASQQAAVSAIRGLGLNGAVVRDLNETRQRRCESWSDRGDAEEKFNSYCSP